MWTRGEALANLSPAQHALAGTGASVPALINRCPTQFITCARASAVTQEKKCLLLMRPDFVRRLFELIGRGTAAGHAILDRGRESARRGGHTGAQDLPAKESRKETQLMEEALRLGYALTSGD